LAHCRGDYVITIDDDLQNPPSEIIHLIQRMQTGGHDVVFGRFRHKRHSLTRRLGSGLIRLINERVFLRPEAIVPIQYASDAP
jgi:undecaprenyl-phosphate 4-deoxy-4-formamido-L-arabinose transferase